LKICERNGYLGGNSREKGISKEIVERKDTLGEIVERKDTLGEIVERTDTLREIMLKKIFYGLD
jgi:hypothetical protein